MNFITIPAYYYFTGRPKELSSRLSAVAAAPTPCLPPFLDEFFSPQAPPPPPPALHSYASSPAYGRLRRLSLSRAASRSPPRRSRASAGAQPPSPQRRKGPPAATGRGEAPAAATKDDAASTRPRYSADVAGRKARGGIDSSRSYPAEPPKFYRSSSAEVPQMFRRSNKSSSHGAG